MCRDEDALLQQATSMQPIPVQGAEKWNVQNAMTKHTKQVDDIQLHEHNSSRHEGKLGTRWTIWLRSAMDVEFTMGTYKFHSKKLKDEPYLMLNAHMDSQPISTYMCNAQPSMSKSDLRTLDYKVIVRVEKMGMEDNGNAPFNYVYYAKY